MSTTEQRRDQAKEEARYHALSVCSDFLSDWSRVYSIIGLMEEAVEAEVQEANATNDRMETYVAEEFAANMYWLRQKLDESGKAARESLEKAGYSVGPRV